MPASTYGDWNKYEWTRAMLASYIESMTGEGDISVQDGTGSTHIATKSVRLPVGTPHAPGVAAHEATHINETDNDAWHHPVILAGGQAYSLLLNSLEDSRMERKAWRDKPGLRVQWQHDMDALYPTILEEDWLMQALKFMCIETTGYDVPDRKMLAPKARKMLKAYDESGIMYKVRKAADTMELVPLVPLVAHIFDEYKPPKPEPEPPPPPKPPVPEGATGEGDDDREHETRETSEPNPFDEPQDGASGDEGDGGDSESTDGASGQQGQPSEATDGPPGHTDDVGDGSCELCDAIEAGEEAPVRAPQTFDADKAGHDAAAADKMGESGESGGHQHAENVDGYDRATGGPSANRLLERATKLAQAADKMQRKHDIESIPDEDEEDDIIRVPAPAATPVGEATDEAMPEAAREWVDVDKKLNGAIDRFGRPNNPQAIDLKKMLPAKAAGSLGYGAQTAHLTDGRKPHYSVSPDVLKKEASVSGTGSYLGRQMRIWLQSQDRSAMRDHERFGLFDPRRSYAMGAGKFDVYKNPPKHKPTLPVVCLSVDMSSSMTPWGSRDGDGPMSQGGSAFHAVVSAWLLARALSVLRIPFEVSGFGGSGTVWLMKEFSKSYDETAIKALSNIAYQASGGTPAAEGLAFAYARALTRPEQRKVIIQVTDAGVADNTRRIASALREAGTTVIGVGIGTDDERTRYFYGDGFAVQTAAELPGKMVALLRRLTLEGKLA